jgi:hypothetical protein
MIRRIEVNRKRKREDLVDGSVAPKDAVDSESSDEVTVIDSTATSAISSARFDPCKTSQILDEQTIALMERYYWRNLSFHDTMYGADLQGSLFTGDPENKWNVSCLESLLSTVNVPVPGVTTPYLYFGMYKATFAWHVEDMDLFSIK